jgi:hypothetical protein
LIITTNAPFHADVAKAIAFDNGPSYNADIKSGVIAARNLDFVEGQHGPGRSTSQEVQAMDPVEVHEERVATSSPPYEQRPVAPPTAPGQRAATTTYSSHSSSAPAGFRAIQIVWFIIGVINVILAMDFVFRLAAANNVGFAHVIYAMGRAMAAPFDGIFSNTVSDGVYVVKWSDVLAIAVYSLIGWGITKLVQISASRGPATR